MKKVLLKSLAMLLVLATLISMASLALSVSATAYVSGVNSVSSSYKAGRYYKNLSQITLTGNNRADLLAVALSQVGYQENSSNSALSGETGTSGNYTEFNYNFGNIGTWSYAWCAAFCTWSLRQAGINKVGTGLSNAARNHLGDSKYIWAEVSCGYWVSQLQRCGYWKGSAGRFGGTYTPKSGDLIFFESSGDSWADHIGIVVYTSGSTVYTIEGNTSSGTGLEANGGGVYFKSYSLSSTKIYGYGAMPYNSTSSPIDYSGKTPTTGLYVGKGNKYLYTSTACTSYSVLTAGTVFKVTQVIGSGLSDSTLLKATVSFKDGTTKTGYIKNNSDRVIQLTKTSSSGGSTATEAPTSAPTSAPSTPASTKYMAAMIGTVAADAGAATTISGATANQDVVNAAALNTSAKKLTVTGWAMIEGGQSENFVYSVDNGSTWKTATFVSGSPGDSTMDAHLLALSGASSWSSIDYVNAHYKIEIDLSASAGKTVSVLIGRKSDSGTTFKVGKITGVTVPSSSSSGGGTTTSTLYYAASLDTVNGEAPSESVTGNQYSQSSFPFGSSVKTLTVKGWCAMSGGQGDMYYSTDGGTTWVSVTNSLSGTPADASAIQTAAAALSGATAAGATCDWTSDTDYRFNITIDLSAYAGKTISTLTIGRKANSDSKTYPLFQITSITVPAAASGDSGSSGSSSGTLSGTPVATNGTSTAWPYLVNVDLINGLGSDGNALNSSASNAWALKGYRTSTEYTSNPKAVVPATVNASTQGISVNSDKTVSIKGWGLVNGGQAGYVYSIDGVNWYACTGTLGTSSDDITAMKTLASDSMYGLNSFAAANCNFSDLKADLTGCEGKTVNLMFGIQPALGTTAICHFLTISNLTVPSSSSGSSGSGSSGSATPTVPGTPVATGGTSTAWGYVTAINLINGLGTDGQALNSTASNAWTLSGSRTADKTVVVAEVDASTQGVSVNSDKSVFIQGWGVVNGGQAGYVYSIDGTNWYSCTGSLSDSSADITAIKTLASGDPWNLNSFSAANCIFSNLKADLTGCEGHTINLMFGIQPALATTSICHFLTIKNLTVPGTASSGGSTPTESAGTVTNTPIPSYDSTVWTINRSNGALTYGSQTFTPASFMNSSILALGNQKNITDNGTYASFGPVGAGTHQQYVIPNLPRYVVMKYRAPTGTWPQAVLTYYDTTYDADALITPAWTTDGQWHTLYIDMLGAMPSSGTVFGIIPDNHGTHTVDIEYIAFFTTQAAAEQWKGFEDAIGTFSNECAHTSGTNDIIAARAATCGATGYTAGKRCVACGYVVEAPKSIAATTTHTLSADTCTGSLRTCTTCGATKVGTLAHVDGNSDGVCDYGCGTQMGTSSGGSSGSGGSGSETTTTPQAYDFVSVINAINDVGPDGTANSNYAADLIAHGTMLPSAPASTVAQSATYISISGWCMINGGQNNVIKYSTDGGTTWLGNCTVASFSDGTSAHSDTVSAFVGMPNPVLTGANFANATVNKSALGSATSVTFGREGADGKVYAFATVTNISSGTSCSHSYNISAATCTTAKVCTLCGAIAEEAKGHSLTDTAAIAATCTTAGKTSGQTCSACGYTTCMDVPALGHNYVVSKGYAATCKTDGLTDGEQCSICKVWTTTQTVISKDTVAHSYVYSYNATQHWQVCTVCDAETTKANHTYGENSVCSVCGQGCDHTSSGDATCTTPETCSKCGYEMTAALGHNWSTSYATNDTNHWRVCLRVGCSAVTENEAHSYSNNRCECGKKLNTYPNFHTSVDFINGVGPNNNSTPYTDNGGNTSKGCQSVVMPFSTKITKLTIQGWALVDGNVKGYKWSVDGTAWNSCSYDSLSNAGSAHLEVASGSGVSSSVSTANSLFNGLCADLTYYVNQSNISVTFAVETEDGEIVPFITITGINVGAPSKTASSFDAFYIGSTITGMSGYTSGTVGSVTVSGVNAATGVLSMSNILAGTSIALWGWAGFDAEVASFGYYFNGYTNDLTLVDHYPTTEDAVIAAGGQYARRFLIRVNTATLSGNNTVTFVAQFKDGTIKELTTWNLSVIGSSSSSGSGTISNQYANVIIISGQSNAYGASPTDYSGYPIASETFSNIKIRYNLINQNANNNYKLQTMVSSGASATDASDDVFVQYKVGIGAEAANRIGPEYGLAKYIQSAYTNGEQFYIIKFAAAGTFLDGDWFEGDAIGKAATADRAVTDMGAYLYDQMIAYINTSIAQIQSETSLPVKIHSFMWIQGESDAGESNMAAAYESYEQRLVNGVRSYFSAYAASGGISFIDYSIVNKAGIWAYPDIVNACKKNNAQYLFDTDAASVTEKASYNLPKSLLLTKTDWNSKYDDNYTVNMDKYHLGAQAMYTIGYSMGSAMGFLDGKGGSTHTHTAVEIPAVAATCEASGLTAGTKCSECQAVLVAQTLVPATGHTYDSDSDMTCNTCGEARDTGECTHEYNSSVYYYNETLNYHYNMCQLCFAELNAASHVYDSNPCDSDCNVCGYVRTVSHSPVTIAGTPATCLSSGVTDSTICQYCAVVITAGTTLKKLSHDFSNTTVIAPTCAERGYTLHYCDNGCNRSYKTDYTLATGHSYTSEVVDATCTALGCTIYTCSKCNDSYETNFSPALGHTYTTTTVDATFNEAGYTLHSCTREGCGFSYRTDYTPALSHSYTATVVAPTCIERGYTLYTCACGDSYRTSYTDATGHNYVATNTVEATCTTTGYTAYGCSNCSSTYKTNFAPAKGHTYESVYNEATGQTTHTCKNGCGASYVTDNTTDIHFHSYTATVTAPTCTEQGYTTYTCACGNSEYVTNYTPATGHTYTSVVTAPTCDAQGYTTYTCACGDSKTSDYTDATGHTLTLSNRVYATMTTDGYCDFSCSKCSYTKRGNTVSYSDIVSPGYTGTTTPVAQGIDVSYWQNGGDALNPLDWAAIKAAGIDFVIIRAGTSNMKDPAFDMNYNGAKAAGLDVGAYFYTYSTTVEGAQSDAETLISYLEGKKFEYPIYFDLENDVHKELSAETLKNITNSFMNTMMSNGYYAALYIYESFLQTYLDTEYTIATYDIWYASYLYANMDFQWSTDATVPEWTYTSKYPTAFGMYQFASTSHIGAYGTQNFDANIAYKDYPTLIKKLGLNGYDLEYSEGETQYVWIKATSLNVRSSADFTSTTNKIGYVYSGERYEVIESTSAYTKIWFNGQEAYISAKSEYVSFTEI